MSPKVLDRIEPKRRRSHREQAPEFVSGRFLSNRLGQIDRQQNLGESRLPHQRGRKDQPVHPDDQVRLGQDRPEVHRPLGPLTWTLDLDPRYRVIALCIAQESLARRSQDVLSHGFDVNWVRQQALFWWPQGFVDDRNNEAFRTLLEEMIGLGILRRIDGIRYGLRSTNVLNLLGTQKEIDDALEDASQVEKALAYHAGTFHRARANDPSWRSPLTAAQESDFLAPNHGVSILFGSRMAGLDEVHEAIREITELARSDQRTVRFRAFEAVPTLDRFRTELEDLANKRTEDLTLALVLPSCPWSEAWVKAALKFAGRRTSHSKVLRVLFVGDPANAWNWPSDQEDSRERNELEEVLVHNLLPWSEVAVRRWLQDGEAGLLDRPGLRNRLLEVTGYWSDLLIDFDKACREKVNGVTEVLDRLEKETPANREKWEHFGLVPQTLPVMRTLAELGMPVSAEDLVGLVPGMDGSLVCRVISWADSLGFVRREAELWTVDPVLRASLLHFVS